MSSTVSERIELGSDAALALSLPAAATREPDGGLPSVDVSNLAGARVAVRRGYRDGALTVRLVCVTAPASGWAAGLEEIVLGRANQLAREALGGEVTSFSVGEQRAEGSGFDQRFQGVVRRVDGTFAAHGRHWLGFSADPRDATVCTAACTEPEATRACGDLIAATVPTGAWLGPPEPGILARALLVGAGHPTQALGVLACATLLVAAVVVARRPRPRP